VAPFAQYGLHNLTEAHLLVVLSVTSYWPTPKERMPRFQHRTNDIISPPFGGLVLQYHLF
jgi:hypothetical protein